MLHIVIICMIQIWKYTDSEVNTVRTDMLELLCSTYFEADAFSAALHAKPPWLRRSRQRVIQKTVHTH